MRSNAEDPSIEAVYLIAVRLHPDAAGSQLYTVLLMYEDARDGKDRPLTDTDGYILWFREPDLAAHAIALGDEGFRKHAIPAEVAATYDFAAMAWAISQGVGNVSGEVVEALNLLLDLVEATGFPMPAAYRRDLHALADHLTFSTDVAAFVTQGEDLRVRLMDAITWCVGAVTIKSTIVGDPGLGATQVPS
jgi:hypothetical protein